MSTPPFQDLQSLYQQWQRLVPSMWTPLAQGSSAGIPSPTALLQWWSELASPFVGSTPAQLATAFERSHGALNDALGLGPARELQATAQDMAAADVAQNEARARYLALIQSAMATGMERLMERLAEKAGTGERIDSVLALLRLWAVCTEEAVHETLQSEAGLEATAALTRSSIAHRNQVRRAAAIVAQGCDLATRDELDDAYREIQALKREVRALRRDRSPPVVTARHEPAPASRKRRGKESSA